jgi:hypothetical protein
MPLKKSPHGYNMSISGFAFWKCNGGAANFHAALLRVAAHSPPAGTLNALRPAATAAKSASLPSKPGFSSTSDHQPKRKPPREHDHDKV